MDTQRIEMLIDLIRDYPELYDMGHAHYRDACKKEMAWSKLQEELGVEVNILKGKWRNLRDTYKKHKQCHLPRCSDATKKYANWIWADRMSFIDSSGGLRLKDSTLNTSTSILDNSTEVNLFIDEDSSQPESTQFLSVGELEIDEQEQSLLEIKIEPEENARKRRCVYKTDVDDKTVNPLKIQVNTANSITRPAEDLVKVACDRVDMEFLGYANSVKGLPLRKQAVVKLKIASLITQAQLQEYDKS